MRFLKLNSSCIAVLGIIILIASGVGEVLGQPKMYEEFKLIAPGGQHDDNFGISVAIDGEYAIVGADLANPLGYGPKSGAAYIFERIGDSWIPDTLDTGQSYPNDHFGRSVSISGDYAIVGAWGFDDISRGDESGVAYIFKRNGNSWARDTVLVPTANSDHQLFGFSVAICGDYAIVGAYADETNGPSAGAAYIFRRIAGIWLAPQKITPQEPCAGQCFGYSVSICCDHAIVGAPWDSLGGCIRTGSAYIFQRNDITGIWEEEKRLLAEDGEEGDFFGGSVSISDNYAVVGAWQKDYKEGGVTRNNAGVVYLFSKYTAWDYIKITAPDPWYGDNFGKSVSNSGEYAFVGAHMIDEGGKISTGAGYVFKRKESGRWAPGKVWASDSDELHHFGQSIAISPSCEYAIVGAPGWADGNGPTTGAAYVYVRPFYIDTEYFVHLADVHVNYLDNDRWVYMLDKILKMVPPPKFIMCAGDLVDWGGSTSLGDNNYVSFTEPLYTESPGIHYVCDSNDTIPIFFCPGNHDHREATSSPWPHSLDNYKTYINNPTYYHTIIDETCAIFALDSGWDRFKDLWPVCHIPWPEGAGLDDDDFSDLAIDLDLLDGDQGGYDGSPYTKIIMMHHPHKNPKRHDYWLLDCPYDGEFGTWNNQFKDLCLQYGVHYVLYGHLHKKIVYDVNGNHWSSGETKCFAADDAKAGNYHWHAIGDDISGNVDLWDEFEMWMRGNILAYAIDQNNDTTGVDENGDVQLGIPWSLYERVFFNDTVSAFFDTVTTISVIKADTLSYTFIFEALADDTISLTVQEEFDCNSYIVAYYEDVPMYYDENTDSGSVATLTAGPSGFSDTLTIVDPEGGPPRKIVSRIVTNVEMLFFSAKDQDSYVKVEWVFESENNLVGFNIHRSTTNTGEYAKINEVLIPVRSGQYEVEAYSFIDKDVTNGVTYYYWLEYIDINDNSIFYGPVSATFTSVEEDTPIPNVFSLAQNYPNPFNATTDIKYGLPKDCNVSLTIYNVAGQRIRMLADEHQKAGYKVVHWDGKNNEGHGVSSGIYFYRLVAGDFTKTKKMVLLR